MSARAYRFRTAVCLYQLLMSMLRLPGGCIAFVPISPDVMKFPFDAGFGFACLLRYLVMWGDHPDGHDGVFR